VSCLNNTDKNDFEVNTEKNYEIYMKIVSSGKNNNKKKSISTTQFNRVEMKV